MPLMTKLLAQIDPDALAKMQQQILEIHERVAEQPLWAFKLMWLLPLLLVVAVFILFQRQKKIAQNQVGLAKLLDQLIDRSK